MQLYKPRIGCILAAAILLTNQTSVSLSFSEIDRVSKAIFEARFEAETAQNRNRQIFFAGVVALLVFNAFLLNDYKTRAEIFDQAVHAKHSGRNCVKVDAGT